MKNEENKDELYGNKFKKTTTALKVIGFILLPIGLACILIGTIDFFKSSSNFETPKYFYLNFIGIPLLAIGIMCLVIGFRKNLTEFAASQTAKTQKDVANYMIKGTRDEMTETVESFNEAFKNPTNEEKVNICEKCGEKNPIEAKFCSKCGSAIIIKCPVCGNEMDDGAKFCNNCGNKLQ